MPKKTRTCRSHVVRQIGAGFRRVERNRTYRNRYRSLCAPKTQNKTADRLSRHLSAVMRKIREVIGNSLASTRSLLHSAHRSEDGTFLQNAEKLPRHTAGAYPTTPIAGTYFRSAHCTPLCPSSAGCRTLPVAPLTLPSRRAPGLDSPVRTFGSSAAIQ